MPLVTLLQRHTHAGCDYSAGDTLNVGESDHAWLRRQGVIEDHPPDEPPSRPSLTDSHENDDHAAN